MASASLAAAASPPLCVAAPPAVSAPAAISAWASASATACFTPAVVMVAPAMVGALGRLDHLGVPPVADGLVAAAALALPFLGRFQAGDAPVIQKQRHRDGALHAAPVPDIHPVGVVALGPRPRIGLPRDRRCAGPAARPRRRPSTRIPRRTPRNRKAPGRGRPRCRRWPSLFASCSLLSFDCAFQLFLRESFLFLSSMNFILGILAVFPPFINALLTHLPISSIITNLQNYGY